MQFNQDTLFAAGLFTTSVLVVYGLTGLVLKPATDPVLQRLHGGRTPSEAPARRRREAISPAVTRISAAVSRPFLRGGPQGQAELRKRLSYAGLYSPHALQLFVGLRVVLMTVCTMLGLCAAWLLEVGSPGLYGCAAVGAIVGYVAPGIWLGWKVRHRQLSLERALPDVLDLMVVCVESGLTIDAAIQRVGNEIALVHPDISRELAITHMETRVGVTRVDALRNLGIRTGSAPLKSLAAVLVQTERFGTSIAQALRVHSDSLRTKRQHRAEEQAAKTTVKLAFPVVLFIFPTLLVVLGGPAFILFFKSPLFNK